MKRVIVVLAGVAAFLAFAAAAYASYSHSVTLKVNGGTTLTAPQGAALTFTGIIQTSGSDAGHHATISEYPNNDCVDSQGVQVVVSGASDSEGAYSASYTLPANAALGKHYYQAHHDDDQSSCLTVTVTARAAGVLPPPPSNAFLCYSATQTNPGVWSMDQAAALLKQGYWSPYAVPGTVAGGTNVGGYHLVCNLASGQAAGDATLGGAGETYGKTSKPDVQNVPGHYPVVGP